MKVLCNLKWKSQESQVSDLDRSWRNYVCAVKYIPNGKYVSNIYHMTIEKERETKFPSYRHPHGYM